jgi:hypothetical protein
LSWSGRLRSVEDAINDIAVDALESGQTYVVQNERGEREPLFGASVFALRAGVPLIELLSRFDEAPSYLEAQVGALRSARFVVLPTGANACCLTSNPPGSLIRCLT